LIRGESGSDEFETDDRIFDLMLLQSRLSNTTTDKPRIMVISTQYPNYGGAATNAYAIIKLLRQNGYPVIGIFCEKGHYNFDPDNLGGIFSLHRIYDDGKMGIKGETSSISTKIQQYLGGSPDVILAKNYLVPSFSRDLFPDARVYYLVSGSFSMSELTRNEISTVKFLSDPSQHGLQYNSSENESIEKTDFIVTNSSITRKIYQVAYPDYISKMTEYLDTTLFNDLRIDLTLSPSPPPSPKKYDIIFIVSRTDRPVKNSQMVRNIFNHQIIKNYRKLFIGMDITDMFPADGDNNLVNAGFCNRDEILKYLSESKVLLCPSYFDSSANVVIEALSRQCLPLISKNVGNYETISTYLNNDNFPICNDVYDLDEWVRHTDDLVRNYQDYANKLNLRRLGENIEAEKEKLFNLIDMKCHVQETIIQ